MLPKLSLGAGWGQGSRSEVGGGSVKGSVQGSWVLGVLEALCIMKAASLAILQDVSV